MPERTAPVHPPSLDDLAAWAEAAYAELPEFFRRHTTDIVFKVYEFRTRRPSARWNWRAHST